MAVERLKCIAHAEDDEHDRFFFQRACQQVGLPCVIQSLRDGEEAMDYLNQAAGGTDPLKFPLPNLLVMDLKMPKASGLEVLAWIRQHEVLQPLPVMMFSSSSMPADIITGYKLGANAYLTKPAEYERLIAVARFIGAWLQFCEPAFGSEFPIGTKLA